MLSFCLACTAIALSADPTQLCWAINCRVRLDRDLKTSAHPIARSAALGNRLDQEPVARPLNAKVRAGSRQVGTCSARGSWLFEHVAKSEYIVASRRMLINGKSLRSKLFCKLPRCKGLRFVVASQAEAPATCKTQTRCRDRGDSRVCQSVSRDSELAVDSCRRRPRPPNGARIVKI